MLGGALTASWGDPHHDEDDAHGGDGGESDDGDKVYGLSKKVIFHANPLNFLRKNLEQICRNTPSLIID